MREGERKGECLEVGQEAGRGRHPLGDDREYRGSGRGAREDEEMGLSGA